jgi:hypothetical protein
VCAVLAPLADDPLEPTVLDEGDLWVIAAIQTLRQMRGDSAPLRITSRDALDLVGGVLLQGTSSANRLPRRASNGSWNQPAGPAFHPLGLSDWVTHSTHRLRCGVELKTDSQGMILFISGEASGLNRLLFTFGATSRKPWSQPEGLWYFGSALMAAGALSPWSPMDLSSISASRAASASLQKYGRFLEGGKTLTDLGGLADVDSEGARLRFNQPASILRLAAMCLRPGLIQLSAVRPWGWLAVGGGLDEIAFVRSAHAFPPTWICVPGLVAITPPVSLLETLGKWAGLCVGAVSVKLADAIR